MMKTITAGVGGHDKATAQTNHITITVEKRTIDLGITSQQGTHTAINFLQSPQESGDDLPIC